MTFKFKTEDDVITKKIDGIKNKILNTDKLIDKLDLKNSTIDVVVRFQILSNTYGNFLGMVMEKLNVVKEFDSDTSEISLDYE